MNITLVALHAYPSPQAVPLATACLAAALATDEQLSTQVSITLRDFHITERLEHCVDAILSTRPGLVGFSVYLWNRAITLTIVKRLRSLRPELTIFAGGPEPTSSPEKLLAEAPFDFLIVGEGEVPFLEAVGRLVGNTSPAGLDGVAMVQDGRFTIGRQRPVPLLDSYPSPVLAGLLDSHAPRGMLWEVARGCDFACAYCADVRGGAVRRHSLERLRAELEHFVRQQVPQVFVLDSTFNRDRKHAASILRMIRAVAPHLHFHFEVRAEFIDDAQARLFAAIPCSLQIGLQSANPQVLALVSRNLDPADFRRRIGILNREGVVFGFDLIYGLPGDTLAGFAASLDFSLELQPNGLDIFPLALLPGTPLARKAGTLGLDCDPEPPYLVRKTPGFSTEDLAAAARLTAACDILYSRGRAVAWFMPVARAARLQPSKLLERFASWLEVRGVPLQEHHLSDHEIWQLQRAFLTTVFNDRKQRLLAAALDFVDYHYYYAEALLASPPQLPTDREIARADLLALPLTVAPSTRLARFSHEIFDILESDCSSLAEFTACFTAAGSQAAIYPRGGQVLTESLDDSYFKLLERLDGSTPAKHLATQLTIPHDVAREFLEFALAEGIIQLG